MYLDNTELNQYRTKINQLIHTQCVLQQNGIFDIHNVNESDKDRILSVLKRQPYIADVSAYPSGYNFGRANFELGTAIPERKFTIRGILKDIDLNEAVEIHDELNPKIWTKENELIPEVRAKILQIVDKFKNLLALDKVELKIDDIYLLGSNANFNYNNDSDLDIHIIADESFDCSNEHLKIIYDAYKALFNNKYDITIKGINVELYVENKDKLSNVSAGVYSFNKGWIKNPSRYEIPEIDQFAIDKGVAKWEADYYSITEDPSIKKIDDYVNAIYEMRQKSIQEEGEFGEGNLIFKEIRRLGYLSDLRQLKIDLTSKELSLEALEEDVNGDLYEYEGPVYAWGLKLTDKWNCTTKAVSAKKALNNIRYRASQAFGTNGIELVPECLSMEESQEDEEIPVNTVEKCDKCGAPLMDNGECPYCDHGDSSALEENKE